MSDHDSTEGMDPLAAAGSGAFKLLQTIASGRGGLTAVLFSKQLVAHDQRRLKMIGELARTDPGLRELLGLNNQLQLPEADPSAFEGDGAQPSVPQIVAAQEAGILPSEAGSRHPLWLRFYREEQQKQESTGRVLDAAKRELDRREEAGQQPAEEPVDATWASRFFEQAKLIQDAEMQEAWGRLLAEEVMKPGSVSPRSVQVLQGMDRRIASVWNKVVALSLRTSDAPEGPGRINLGLLPKFWIGKSAKVRQYDLIELQSAGLIGIMASAYTLSGLLGGPDVFSLPPYIVVSDPVDRDNSSPMEIFPFTPAGQDLANLVTEPTSLVHVKETADLLARHKTQVTVYNTGGMTLRRSADGSEKVYETGQIAQTAAPP